MAQIHGQFQRHISTALDVYGVCPHEFGRARKYQDFKIDLAERGDAKSIAALALSALCDGSKGTMDMAVVHASVDFLDHRIGRRNRTTLNEIANGIMRALPIAASDARALIGRWYDG